MLLSALFLWALAALLTACWLLTRQPEAEPAAAADPWAAEMDQWRREVHDSARQWASGG